MTVGCAVAEKGQIYVRALDGAGSIKKFPEKDYSRRLLGRSSFSSGVSLYDDGHQSEREIPASTPDESDTAAVVGNGQR